MHHLLLSICFLCLGSETDGGMFDGLVSVSGFVTYKFWTCLANIGFVLDEISDPYLQVFHRRSANTQKLEAKA